jgi:formamidopyrimidine-DNA glycosylase
MPELPEVETMCRGIQGIVGRKIVNATRTACRQKPILITPRIDRFRRLVSGTTVREVARVGKRVVIWLDSESAIVVEPRMTGLVLVNTPPSQAYLRWRLDLSGTPVNELYYWDRRGLGNVRLLSAARFFELFGPPNLGPDALSVTASGYRQQLNRSKRTIKVALLDQRVVAGIGNLYAAEILHVAGIHPERRCDLLKNTQWEKLADATHEVLEEAIRYEGSTLSDGTYRNALNKQGSYQNHHRVYARAGTPCPTCNKGKIVRIVQSQRATFFCPCCQLKTTRR